MKAELISIGDEILIGQIVNTNSVFLAKQFNRIGVEIAQITAISDQKNVIIDALDKISSYVKIGQENRIAIAIASDVLESISISSFVIKFLQCKVE